MSSSEEKVSLIGGGGGGASTATASSSSSASHSIVRDLDDTQRHQRLTQWSGLIIAINVITIVLGLIVFGIGIHVDMQGYGGSSAALFIGIFGLFAAVLALMCFYGVRAMDTKFSAGMPWARFVRGCALSLVSHSSLPSTFAFGVVLLYSTSNQK